MKLIDKDALVAETKKLIRENELYLSENISDTVRFQKTGAYSVLNDLLHFLDTLEVKKVKGIDLEKEVDTWRHNHFHGRRDKDASGEYLERSSQLDIAEHFFNLGLISQDNKI